MRRNGRSLIYISLIIIGFFSVLSHGVWAAKAQNQSDLVTVLTIDGAIGPGIADYVQRGIKTSGAQNAKAIVLRMDTPGGLSTAMRRIIKAILGSNVPVIGYVSPSGARAASAGTYILYASHIAAMAPGTNLGAATPVSIASPSGNDKPADKKKGSNKALENDAAAKNAKALNDAKAYIRSLAQLRNRNVTWAVKAVEKAESLSAKEALKKKVIDFVSPSVQALIKSVNGKTVKINDVAKKLVLSNPVIKQIKPDWKSKILHVITNPSVAYILMMIGVYGLFFEFMNPGFVLPGVAGAISLLLALYAFQLLPISYVGFGLIILGAIFMVSEAFLPSFGVLGFGGIISFLIGSFLLFDTKVPGFTLPWQLIVGVTASTVIFMFGLVLLLIRSRRRKVVSGVEGMIGKTGVVEQDGDAFWVIVSGERWHVDSDGQLIHGQVVTVVKVKDLTLIVK